ncbi:VWA domain-containing protein [Thermostilla marina]
MHVYQRYDPQRFPGPRQPTADIVTPAFEHLLAFGDLRELTEEELAEAIELDPRMIAGLGPSIDALLRLLKERKAKILATYETHRVQREAARRVEDAAKKARPPALFREAFRRAVAERQIYDLERLWYRAERRAPEFSRCLPRLIEHMGNLYQVELLASRYAFSGREPLTVEQALTVKEELETIDRLIAQLEEAKKKAKPAIIDMQALARFAEKEQLEDLQRIADQIREMLDDLARRQGLERTKDGFVLTPKAYRLFQAKLLDRIFSDIQAARSGRHRGPIAGEGAVELPDSVPYEFGDSPAAMDIPGTMINAMIRSGTGLPIRFRPDDILVHRTRNTPKCATVVLMDMSGSMRYDGLYVDVKRMALALHGLIVKEYPGDILRFVEVYSVAKMRHPSEIAALLPKPVTIFDPIVRLRADMSDPNLTESDLPPHFTNIQHGLSIARRLLAGQDTPNRQIILITDGLPTAHFEEEQLFFLYPPDPRTEEATLREAHLCAREDITINIFLLSSWNQSRADIQFAYRLAESTQGRVFFTAGRNLDRYVVWDYFQRRRDIIS